MMWVWQVAFDSSVVQPQVILDAVEDLGYAAHLRLVRKPGPQLLTARLQVPSLRACRAGSTGLPRICATAWLAPLHPLVKHLVPCAWPTPHTLHGGIVVQALPRLCLALAQRGVSVGPWRSPLLHEHLRAVWPTALAACR